MKLHDTDRKFVFQITSSGDDGSFIPSLLAATYSIINTLVIELHISAGSEDTRNAWVCLSRKVVYKSTRLIRRLGGKHF